MQLQVVLDTGGVSPPGIDMEALRDDIEVELNGFADQVKASAPQLDRVPPPPGAQGEDLLLQWLIAVAQEPAMLKVYARALLFALNELALGYGGQTDGRKEEDASPDKFVVRVKALGQEIALPAATAVIKQFIDHLTPPEQ
jgi:hypothetical protein